MTCVRGPPYVRMSGQVTDEAGRWDDAHESFLPDKKINQPFNVWFFPLKLVRMSVHSAGGSISRSRQSDLLG